jgi:hypothetical protein
MLLLLLLLLSSTRRTTVIWIIDCSLLLLLSSSSSSALTKPLLLLLAWILLLKVCLGRRGWLRDSSQSEIGLGTGGEALGRATAPPRGSSLRNGLLRGPYLNKIRYRDVLILKNEIHYTYMKYRYQNTNAILRISISPQVPKNVTSIKS